jgi:death-on-curing protein
MTRPVWLPRTVVEEIHREQLARHGGSAGVRDLGLLESALARPQNAWAYGETDIPELAALYAEGIARNHPFIDGNKRTAFMAAYAFLRANGRRLRADNAEAVQKVLGLASGTLPRKDFAAWLRERTVPT